MSAETDTDVKIEAGQDHSGPVRKFRTEESGFRWDGIPLKNYKEDGTHFKSITRQNLFGDEGVQPCELRYFEIQPGGYSTFEKHVHTHAIIVLRGRGRAIVGDAVASVQALDLVHVPSATWHQLQASDDEALGFVCQVPCERDRPIRPTDEERDKLLSHPTIGDMLRL